MPIHAIASIGSSWVFGKYLTLLLKAYLQLKLEVIRFLRTHIEWGEPLASLPRYLASAVFEERSSLISEAWERG